MGASKSRKSSVDSRVSTAIEQLEKLMGDEITTETTGPGPKTVEDAVRRVKGQLPDK